MAGDERIGDIEDYVRAFEIAREAGLGITVHAGELAGWESVQAALDHIRPSRIGHGVRAIENPDLVRRIADEGVVLECCPGSNIALKVFDELRRPSLPEAAGGRLQGDAEFRRPALFLDLAEARIRRSPREHFGMNEKALLGVTRTAIEAAFVDKKTRAALLARLKTPAGGR